LVAKQIPYTVTEYRTEQKQQPYYVTIQEPHQKQVAYTEYITPAHSADPSEEGAQGSSAEDPHRIQIDSYDGLMHAYFFRLSDSSKEEQVFVL